MIRTTLTLLTFALGLQTSFALDWPQWRGPNRDGVNPEKNLLEKWPEGGPKLLWRASGVGVGFSSVAASEGILYTLGDLKDACYLIALDLKGKHLWKGRVGEPGGHRKYPGPRSTPTVVDGKVYVLGQQGDLVCFDIKTKKEAWRVNVAKDFGGSMMSGWRWSESPLIDGDKVVVTPGGSRGTVIALDKNTGKEIWRSKDSPIELPIPRSSSARSEASGSTSNSQATAWQALMPTMGNYSGKLHARAVPL